MEKLDLSHIGGIIKKARLDADMTQEDLAERIDKTPRFIMAIENEGRGLSLDTLIRILRVLNLSGDAIVYPDRDIDNTEEAQLLRMTRQLSSRDRKILLSLAKEMLNNQ
ncbi:MAG: helix-turn-helix transcriptional regulator [Lachnospiraceae bacterium]|nr:helix-turn-helix transcriptional regulator [Lachnospiraceae bacterium]